MTHNRHSKLTKKNFLIRSIFGDNRQLVLVDDESHTTWYQHMLHEKKKLVMMTENHWVHIHTYRFKKILILTTL